MPAQPSSSVSIRPLHTSFGHCFPPAPAFSQQPSSLRSTLPAQHIRPSGFFCCWSDGLELIAWRHARSGVFCGQLQTVTEDIFIFAVLVCSEVCYENALYKFTFDIDISSYALSIASTGVPERWPGWFAVVYAGNANQKPKKLSQWERNLHFVHCMACMKYQLS